MNLGLPTQGGPCSFTFIPFFQEVTSLFSKLFFLEYVLGKLILTPEDHFLEQLDVGELSLLV